jgi:Flp pilus assembly pilin Flp
MDAMKVLALIARFAADTRGATRIEFGLMASLLGMLVIVIATTMTAKPPASFVGSAGSKV